MRMAYTWKLEIVLTENSLQDKWKIKISTLFAFGWKTDHWNFFIDVILFPFVVAFTVIQY